MLKRFSRSRANPTLPRYAAAIAFLATALTAGDPALARPTFPAGWLVEEYASDLGAANGIEFGPDGRLYVADYASSRLLRFPADYDPGSNAYDTLDTGIGFQTDVALTGEGSVFVSSSGDGAVYAVRDDGGATRFFTGLSAPTAVEAFDGRLYVACSGDGTIQRIDQFGVSPFLSGFSAPDGPYGVSIGVDGVVHFSDHMTGIVYRANLEGDFEPLAALTPFGTAFTEPATDGALFVSDPEAAVLWRVDADGNVEEFASEFAGKNDPPAIGPTGIAIDAAGRIYVADADRLWRFSPDADNDGVADTRDNCTLVYNPDQRDTNGDGFGNLCDADLNNDGITNFIDVGMMKAVFFTADPDADLSGNGTVNFLDLGMLQEMFFLPPGPGGQVQL